jgi:hypothetical protein
LDQLDRREIPVKLVPQVQVDPLEVLELLVALAQLAHQGLWDSLVPQVHRVPRDRLDHPVSKDP